MNMTTIREKSKIFLWICLSGFILSLLGVMGTSGGTNALKIVEVGKLLDI